MQGENELSDRQETAKTFVEPWAERAAGYICIKPRAFEVKPSVRNDEHKVKAHTDDQNKINQLIRKFRSDGYAVEEISGDTWRFSKLDN